MDAPEPHVPGTSKLPPRHKKALRRLQEEFALSQELLSKLEKKGGFKTKERTSLPANCLNNSAAKLMEMLPMLWVRGTTKVVDLCGAPGGFAYLIAKTNPDTKVYSFSKYDPKDPYYPQVRECKNVEITCSDSFGDLTNGTTRGICAMLKCQLLLADGSCSTKNRWSLQEVDNCDLVNLEVSIINTTLERDGNFLLKVFNAVTIKTALIFCMLYARFKKIRIVKPKSSSPLSGELYFVCTGYDGRPVFPPNDTGPNWRNYDEALEVYVEAVAKKMHARIDAIRAAINHQNK